MSVRDVFWKDAKKKKKNHHFDWCRWIVETVIGNVLKHSQKEPQLLYFTTLEWVLLNESNGSCSLVPCTNLHAHFLDVFLSIYCNKDQLVKGGSVHMWISGSCRAPIQRQGYRKSKCRVFVHNE